jgi:hypothetical protein
MSHLSRHCRERIAMGASVDPVRLCDEVEYYEEAYRAAQVRLVEAHMMLARNGIDPLTGGQHKGYADDLMYNTRGT